MKPTTIPFDFFGVFVDDIYNVWSQHSLKPDIAKQIRSDVMSKVDLIKLTEILF